jgi:fumarate hydratase class II
MLMTALSPVIGYDKASKIAYHTADHDLALKPGRLAARVRRREDIRPYCRSGQDGEALYRRDSLDGGGLLRDG